MPFIPLSNEVAGIFTPGPAPPVILGVKGDGQTARISIQLPDKDADGQPLTDMASVGVFYKTSSMVGSSADAEIAAGTPAVSIAVTKEAAGQTVEVAIHDLAYRIEYYFDAFVV
jgi:hypothetical protein